MLGYGYDDVSALRDMFDGGGAGQAGDEFRGGGILSLLANMLASPYGSQQEDNQLARTIAGQASPRPQTAPDSSMRPQMRPQGRPDDYMRAGQMLSGEELMRGDDVSIPFYGGREEAFLLPGAFEPRPQDMPSLPTDPAAPRAQPQSAADARAWANVMAGDAADMRMMPGSAAPADGSSTPAAMPVPAANAGEAETALNMFRRGLVSPESSAYMPLANRVVERGTPEQVAELRRILEMRETSAEELSRGGNSPLASTRAPGP